MTALTAKGEEMLADLPHYYADDPNALAVIDMAAREIERVETLILTLRSKGLPNNADDDYGLLAIWEFLLGLPVNPSGVSLANRQAAVRSAYLKRNTAAGADWAIAVNEAIGSSWTYEENQPISYSIRVSVPDTAGYSGGQIQKLLRDATPAHLAITVQTGDGFRVDIDQVDIDTI